MDVGIPRQELPVNGEGKLMCGKCRDDVAIAVATKNDTSCPLCVYCIDDHGGQYRSIRYLAPWGELFGSLVKALDYNSDNPSRAEIVEAVSEALDELYERKGFGSFFFD